MPNNLDLENTPLACDIDVATNLRGNRSYRTAIANLIEKKEPYEIMIFGIDNFKRINDLYSYSFGDIVLHEFASEIRNIVPTHVEIFRLDGDGFGLIALGIDSDELKNLYGEILKLAQTPKNIQGFAISFTISAGICQYPTDGISCDVLYHNARLALSEAKNNSKRCVHYTPELSEQRRLDIQLLDRLQSSVDNNCEGFYLVFQAIVQNDTKECDGCEALLRWNDSLFGEEISPNIFIPILEQSEMIITVGKWILEESFIQCAKWHKLMPTFKMNINVSARQFEDPEFLNFVVDSMAKYNINPNAITLELTESYRVSFEIVYEAFEFLRKQGIQTAFDDFGTGYSSLDIFRSISADKLKIDRSFLERITHDVTDQILLKSIIEMCRSMNIIVCVEGIENVEIENIITKLNPQLLQGFLYSKPLSKEDFEEKYIKGHTSQFEESKKLPTMLYTELRPAKPLTFAEIINNAYASIFQVGMDTEFSFLTCNEGFRRMIGYTIQEIGEKFSNKALGFVHGDDVEWVNTEIRRQLGEGDTVTIEFRIVRSDGKAIWILGTGNVVRSNDRNPSLIIVMIDNTKAKNINLEILAKCNMYEEASGHILGDMRHIKDSVKSNADEISTEIFIDKINKDPLTGLLMKSVLEQNIIELISSNPDSKYALWMIDIDDFKVINDEFGHFIGDEILTIIAKRLRNSFKMNDIIGRSGGDEYLIFMQYDGDENILIEKSKKVFRSLVEPIVINKDVVIKPTLSIGISCYLKTNTPFSELFKKADNALYRVKRNGKNNVIISSQ